jgi:hypothetical protein
MSIKRVLFLAIVALMAVPWASADAYWRVGVYVGGPAYYHPYPYRVIVAPAPVVVAPAPVYYVQPAPTPVYVQQAPVYVQQPAPVPVTTQPPQAQQATPTPQTYQNLPLQPIPVH